MNDKPEFASVLDTPDEEIKEPQPFPVGSYVCLVKGLPEYDKSSQRQTPFARFNLQPLQAMDDVDQQALADMGGFGNRSIRATYYLTEDAAYRAKEFCDHCGVPSGGTLRHRLEQCQGQQVVVVLRHGMSDRTGKPFHEIARTAQVA